MDDKKIARINELAAFAKQRELTRAELEEREKLRREYIDSVKSNLTQQLDNCVIIDENGKKCRIMSKK